MIFTFYKAQGYPVGSSLVVEDKLDLMTALLEKAKSKGVVLLLPTDVVVANKFAADAESKCQPMGLDDIGADSIKRFRSLWTLPKQSFGTDPWEAIAKKLADLSRKGVTIIIGGGDSVAAVEKAGPADEMSHLSTGGGASLELLEGKSLLGVLALNDA